MQSGRVSVCVTESTGRCLLQCALVGFATIPGVTVRVGGC